MFPRFDPNGRLFAPIIPSILENGMHVDGMVEIKPGDAEYAEKFAQAVSIRDSSPDIDAEWPWSGS